MSGPGADTVWMALPVPIVLITAEDRISALNPAAEMFLNATGHGLAGQRVGDCLELDIDLGPSLARARQSAAGLVHRGVATRNGSGQRMAGHLHLAPLGDGTGALVLMIDARAAGGALGGADRVRRAAHTVIGLAEMLAHEIKNPLAGIAGAAQLIEMEPAADHREMTGLILAETRRVVDLLAQVERFGDLRAPRLAPLNVHDILERARMSAALGVAAKMRFGDDYDPSLPETRGDADQLQQVLANLFSNAAEAAGEAGGSITIRTFFEPGLRLRGADGGDRAIPLQIEIIDDGPGIEPELAARVFDPFVSGRPNGSGLGLALVSKIITEHGGSVSLDSRPGRTCFRISLPLADS